jgi:dienelactone hydrolase
MVRGTNDPIISLKVVQDYAAALQTKGHAVNHLEIEGANHAFFDWKPDSKTLATFYTIGVPYAVKMREFFDAVFYPKK